MGSTTDQVDRSGCPVRGKHGTMAAAHRGCTCPDAREALRIYRKRLRERRLTPALVPAIGTQRRIRALQAIGWPLQTLADRLGCTKQHVSSLARAYDRETVHRDTAERVQLVYLELKDRPGPSSSAVKRAAAQGWARPDQWLPDELDDPDAQSDLAYRRDEVKAKAADGFELEEKLELGFTLEQIAAERDIAVESVQRALTRHRLRLARPNRRLVSDEQLEHARDRIAQGAMQKDVAAELGISRSHLCNILAGRDRTAPTSGLVRSDARCTPTAPPTTPRERKSA